MRVLITGGAGFIGSHLADRLLERGYAVRVLDSLVPQVHPGQIKPDYLAKDVEFVRGDVRDAATTAAVLRGVSAVFHFAARVGVGQSMYEIDQYTSTNTLGTAALLQCLIDRPVERLIVASSMSIYGEGAYSTQDGEPTGAGLRSVDQLRRGVWDPIDGNGRALVPQPTPESKTPELTSVYALSKFDQERLALLVGGAYRMPTVALRFFNVYGTRQALSNPYTGVLAIFASRLLNRRAPLVFEDGGQRRDFVSVDDVVSASMLALERPAAAVAGRAFNIASGAAYGVADVARMLATELGVEIAPEITGRHRIGDVRHCFADVSLAQRCLCYEPRVSLAAGLQRLTTWLERQRADDHVANASRELQRRGLTV